jgi:hypothetical protein
MAKAVIQGAHARLAHRRIWALNEKRMVQWAELTDLYDVFGSLGSSSDDLRHAIRQVRSALGDIETEVQGPEIGSKIRQR